MEPFYSDKVEYYGNETVDSCVSMECDKHFYCNSSQDLFSNCPDDVKLEILSYLADPITLCRMNIVCKTWSLANFEERVWKYMFYKDFMWWNKTAKDSEILGEGVSWKEKYCEYHLRGWQWDSSNCNSKLVLSNNNFTANLTTGYTYHGVRTVRGEETGRHYFEVMIEPTEETARFDRGSTIFMGIGVANEKFNTSNCCSGWTRDNSGVGYYNDGQIYAFSERHFGRGRKTSFRTGDRVGVEFDVDQGTVAFYINNEQVTDIIRGLKGKIYPHLILANDIKHKVTITTGKRETKVKTPVETKFMYESQLKMLEEMGFTNRELCKDMLLKYNGDVERLVNEIL